MKTNPITPPPELVEQWEEQWCNIPVIRPSINSYIATQAAQWGADQELEAMLAELKALHLTDGYAARLRAARRPKPPAGSLIRSCRRAVNGFKSFTKLSLGSNTI